MATERYLALPHDYMIVRAISTDYWHWYWICKLHKWRCEYHMTEFMSVPIPGQRRLHD